MIKHKLIILKPLDIISYKISNIWIYVWLVIIISGKASKLKGIIIMQSWYWSHNHYESIWLRNYDGPLLHTTAYSFKGNAEWRYELSIVE